MLQVPHVMQSLCVSNASIESSMLFSVKCGKHGKGARCDFEKLDQKHRIIGTRLIKSVRSISSNHHLLKALTNSDVYVVHTAVKMSTYRFWTETGGQLKVHVKKNNEKYELYVELLSLQITEGDKELIMSWGLFKSDSTVFIPLELSKNCTFETTFVKDSSSRLTVKLDLDANLAPFYVSFVLKSQSRSDLKTSNIRSHRKTNFVVPVGFGSGRPSPLGISFLDDGSINFAFFSRNAESVVLCLYADTTSEKAALEIDLDPYVNRSGDIWHVLIEGSVPFVGYGYRCRSSNGNKKNHVLLDPYAKVVEDLRLGLPRKIVGKICRELAFDWSGDSRPSLLLEKLIVYRLNVADFTKDKSSKLNALIAGSFSGISEKLHHFKDLGVNAILLEPIFPFDEHKGPYFPLHFFSPQCLNKPSGDSRDVAKSLKEMVKKLHANGIEVLLEVVFTHTSEVAALKEIDSSSYYYLNDNSLKCNYTVVQQMILESLRYWVIEFHIDGFCFINSSSLMRDSNGEFVSHPPIIEAITFDPLLSKVKIIADFCDPHDTENKEIIFPHWKRWAEMNAKFCIDVRNFLRGQGPISNLATRLCGSGDIYLPGRGPAFSFNFINRSFGFSLVDLVSFSSTEVESELSWNCGEEGPTNKTVVLETRVKQIRNFLFILFVSLGVPVLNMGDECGQSSGGSISPAYAEREPLDWNALGSGFGIQITQFISFLSSLKTRRNDLLQNKSFLKEENIEWRGPTQFPPNWDDPSCKFLAMTLKVDIESLELVSDSENVGGDLFFAFNSSDHSEEVTLPLSVVDSTWVCLVDTALPFPGFFSSDGVPIVPGVLTYEMKPHSCILFEARSF